MNYLDEKKSQSINKVVNSIKILSLMFSTLIFLNIAFRSVVKFEGIEHLILAIICSVISIIYIIDLSLVNRLFPINENVIFQYIECIILLFVYSKLILSSGGIFSSYKFIFMIFTIIVSIERKFVLSIGVAIYSCLFMIIISYNYHNSFTKVLINDMPIAIGIVIVSLIIRVYILEEKKSRIRIIETANIDYLTRVYNRRFLNRFLKDTFDSASKSGKRLSMILLDIDHFKSVNDLYGHGFGDKVLKDVASIIKKEAGEKNIVARYGGEEFAIVLPRCTICDARLAAEKIRKAIEESIFFYDVSKKEVKITASLGVCTYPDKANTTFELINRADDALYRAKFLSRNRVEVYDCVLEEIRMDMLKDNPEFYSSLKSIMNSINSKDGYTLSHSERMVMYADIFSSELELCERDRKLLRYGAYMHDIGKVNLSYETLMKKSDLINRETEEYKCHSIGGVELIKDINPLKGIHTAILYHHERYDGNGYPYGLKGEDIPYFARIISIINIFDGITALKENKTENYLNNAIEELRAYKGKNIDPSLCEIFIKAILKNKKLFYGSNKNMIDIEDVDS